MTPPRPRRNGLSALAERIGAVLQGERDRWFLWVPVLLAIGIALYFAAPIEPSIMVVGMGTIIACLAYLITRGMAIVALITGALLAVALGVALAKTRTATVESPRLAGAMRNVDVRGFVILSEPRAGTARRVTVAVGALGEMDERERPTRVRVRFAKDADWLKPGDAVRFKATLSPPGRPVLPGDYDFSRAAYFKRIGAVGFATSAPVRDETPGIQPFALRLWAPVERVRQDIGRRVTAALPGERGAIAAALINGERGA